MINTLHSTLCDPIDYVAHQAPLSMGFARQEYWTGLLFSSPGLSSQLRDRTWVSCIGGGFCVVLFNCQIKLGDWY